MHLANKQLKDVAVYSLVCFVVGLLFYCSLKPFLKHFWHKGQNNTRKCLILWYKHHAVKVSMSDFWVARPEGRWFAKTTTWLVSVLPCCFPIQYHSKVSYHPLVSRDETLVSREGEKTVSTFT